METLSQAEDIQQMRRNGLEVSREPKGDEEEEGNYLNDTHLKDGGL